MDCTGWLHKWCFLPGSINLDTLRDNITVAENNLAEYDREQQQAREAALARLTQTSENLVAQDMLNAGLEPGDADYISDPQMAGARARTYQNATGEDLLSQGAMPQQSPRELIRDAIAAHPEILVQNLTNVFSEQNESERNWQLSQLSRLTGISTEGLTRQYTEDVQSQQEMVAAARSADQYPADQRRERP